MIKNYMNLNDNVYVGYDLIAIIGRGNVAKAIYRTMSSWLKDRYSRITKYDPYVDKAIDYMSHLKKYLEKNEGKQVLVIFANMYGTKWKVNQGVLNDDKHIDQILNFVNDYKSNSNINFLLISSIDCAMVKDTTYYPGRYAKNRMMLEQSFAKSFKDVDNKAYIVRLPMLAGIGKNWMHDLDNHNLRPRSLSSTYVSKLKNVIKNKNLDVWIEASDPKDNQLSVRYLNKYLKEDVGAWSSLGLHMNMWMNELDNYVVLDINSMNFADKIFKAMKDRKVVTVYDYQTTIKDYIEFTGNDELSGLLFDENKPVIDQADYIDELDFKEIY